VKLALAVIAVSIVALVAVVAVVVIDERDPTPNTLRDCVDDAALKVVPGIDQLGPLRVDLLAGTLAPAGQVELENGTWATFLRPRDRAYLAAAVTRERLAGPAVVRLVRTEPSLASMVAWGARGEGEAALRACLDAQRA